jgi:hypothetical protein
MDNNSIYQQKRCIDCGTTFDITAGEKIFYESRGWELPIRCKSCREKKKKQRYEWNNESSGGCISSVYGTYRKVYYEIRNR